MTEQPKDPSPDFTPPANPYDCFQGWLAMAENQEINDPSAMCLATASPNGQPHSRMVLLKELDENGFVFYTNSDSAKGGQIAHNNKAALCFHWKSLRKQVRIEGVIEQVSDAQADAYYNSRHRGSRIGAWASKQSQPLESYQTLKNFVEEYEAKFENQDGIPRPNNWNGYRVKPHKIEFWIDGDYRLHQRYEYTKDGDDWNIGMLYP